MPKPFTDTPCIRVEGARVMRKELRYGLLCCSLFMALRCFAFVPHLLLGVLAGIGLCLELIGVLPEHTLVKLNAKKKALFRLS